MGVRLIWICFALVVLHLYVGYNLFVYFNPQLVIKDILAHTVPGSVHLTVNPTIVNTRTESVLPVLQVGRVIIVLQVII